MIALVAVLATLLVVAVVVLAALGVIAARREIGKVADAQVDAATSNRLMDGLYVERVIVTLTNGEAFGGLLVDMDAHTINLRESFSLPGKTEVDGELLIPRADVSYIQKP